ncbi:condensation domain-containing protein [Nonomuraea sp. NPDC004354]
MGIDIEPGRPRGSAVMPASATERVYRPALSEQRGIWLSCLFQSDGSVYVNAYAFLLEGALDLGVLDAAFRGLVRRHEVLRTGLSQDEDAIVQFTIPATNESVLDVEDRAGVPVSSADVERWISEQESLSFDLEHPPLMRAKALRIDVDRLVLVVLMHHIVADGESPRILSSELSRLYEECSKGLNGDVPVRRLPVERIRREQLWLASEEYSSALRERVAELESAKVISLPPSDAEGSIEGSISLSVPVHRVGSFLEYARSLGITDFGAFFALFAGLLCRFSGETDFIVGVAMSTRDESTRNEFGCFVNMVPVEVSVREDMTTEGLLHSVSASIFKGLVWRDLPFDAVVASTPSLRPVNRPPVVQVVFGLEQDPDEVVGLSFPGVKSVNIPVMGTVLEFELECVCRLEAGEFVSSLYWSNKIGRRRAEEFLDAMGKTAEWLGANLGATLAGWPVERRW